MYVKIATYQVTIHCKRQENLLISLTSRVSACICTVNGMVTGCGVSVNDEHFRLVVMKTEYKHDHEYRPSVTMRFTLYKKIKNPVKFLIAKCRHKCITMECYYD